MMPVLTPFLFKQSVPPQPVVHLHALVLPLIGAMSVSVEHCHLMTKVGHFADASWKEHGRFIAGDLAFESVHLRSVEMSHPALPIFAYYLGMLPMTSNGACVELWGSPDPVCLCILNVNHSQTRKSRLTSQAESLSSYIDSACNDVLSTIWNAKAKSAEAINAAKKRKLPGHAASSDSVGVPEENEDHEKMMMFPGATSVAFLGGTIERVRERCAGDCPTVRQTKTVMKMPGLTSSALANDCPGLNTAEKAMAVSAGMEGRVWFGQGLVYDEVYQFLQDISILDKPTEKKAVDGPGAGQTPLAGWFNRLVQTGKSDHETKSNGSHGGLSCPPVSLSLLGNFHPTPAIEMVRGDRGDHGCQAKARLVIVTGQPVQPHEMYEEMGALKCVVAWFPIPHEIIADVGLGDAGKNVHAFVHFFGDHGYPDANSDDDSVGPSDPPLHVPDADGYEHTLPDGVSINVRMRFVDGRYRMEWRIPDRKIKIPPTHDIFSHMTKFVKLCKVAPHRVIKLTTEARGVFLGYQTMYNIKVKQSRDAHDADAGAEYGIAPWKLGQLAACLLMWDILWGVVTPMYKEEQWEIIAKHINRAHRLMDILDGIRIGFRSSIVPVAREVMCVDNDTNIIGAPCVTGVKTTAFARRMLFKADATDDLCGFKCPAARVWRLFTKKEMQSCGRLSLHLFREIAKLCPETIGKFSEDADALLFVVPSNPSAAWAKDLLDFANTTPQHLRATLSMKDTRGGARKSGASNGSAD